MKRRFDPEKFRQQVFEARDRVAPLVPEIDPGDLILILQSLLRPFGTGKRIFMRRTKDGRYVA